MKGTIAGLLIIITVLALAAVMNAYGYLPIN